jgi:hypothetical protein
MKNFARHLTALLAVIPVLCSAVPITLPYIFTTPNWNYTSSSSAALFGSGLNLSFTVNNSSTSIIDPSFKFSDILSVTATAAGGSFSPVITVDANGVAMLRLAFQDNSYGKWRGDSASGAFLQLGQTTENGGGYTPVYISANSGETAAYNVGPNGIRLYVFGTPADATTNQPVATVPEPTTLALVATGLIFAGRRGLRSRSIGRTEVG